MTCCQRRAKRTEKRYRGNSVYPAKTRSKYPVSTFTANEQISCGGCHGLFDLGSNELKIHCNLCNEFFHCKIAGKCQGSACEIITKNGTIHRASYCYGCVGLISGNKILCKDCFLDVTIEEAI